MRRARAQRDTAVQHCLDYFGFQPPDLELDGDARLVVQFEGIRPETTPRVAYAPVDLDRQVSVVIDVPPELYEIVRLLLLNMSAVESVMWYEAPASPIHTSNSELSEAPETSAIKTRPGDLPALGGCTT